MCTAFGRWIVAYRAVSFRQLGLVFIALAGLSVPSAWGGFNAQLEGQSFGSTNWSSANVLGWAELDLIPMRVALSGGPVTGQPITVQFDHTKSKGARVIQGIENLYSFAPSANVVITAGPTLHAPEGQDIWTYTFTVDLTDDAPGFVEFRARVSAGAHYFTGNSLNLGGSPSLGNISIQKPFPTAGAPDLSIVKTGPADANAGAVISYRIGYENRLDGSAASGVQIADTLPAAVTFLTGTGGATVIGNTVVWDLGDLARGASGAVTYQVAVTNVVTTGFTFHNAAAIASAEDDADLTDNFSVVTTAVTSNCVPASIVAEPDDVAACAGAAAVFTVAANGSQPLAYQWRKDGVELPGATNDTFRLEPVTPADAASYDVVITNLCGTVTSRAAILTVDSTVVLTDPSSLVVCLGDPAAFLVSASGDALSYQWRKNGADIAGATNASYLIPAVGVDDAGAYDVVVTSACGGPIGSAAATLTVKSPPVAVDDTYATREDTALVVDGPGVLANDTDADGDALAAALVSGPTHGTLTLNADGSFTYTPQAFYWGDDSFAYRAQDGCGGSAPATVSLTVTHVNHSPVAVPDGYTVDEDATLTVPAPGVLANDTDPDADPLSASLVDGPAHGVLTLDTDGSLTYQPGVLFYGDDSFVYQSSDGAGGTSNALVSIHVVHVNHAPVAVDDSLTVAENSDAQPIDVLANDSDPDADLLTVSEVSQPSDGLVSIAADGGTVAYTPATGFSGTNSFSYIIVDGQGGTATATVTVAVLHVAVAPVAQDDSYQLIEGDILEVDAPGALANDVNPEPTALTASLLAGPSHGSLTFAADGSFRYLPEDHYTGTDSFTYQANNALFDSNVATVHLNVLPLNGADDVDLYVKKAKAKIHWASDAGDTLKIAGQINPRGIAEDLSGATIALEINGISVLPTQSLDARGKARSTSGPVQSNCRLKTANGAYRIKVRGIDLRTTLGLTNRTEAGAVVVDVRLTINGAGLDVPTVVAQLECPYRTTANKNTSLRFRFGKNATLSGAFNCNKTTASQKSVDATVVIRGVVTTVGGAPIVPTGDLTLYVGDAVLSLPLASLSRKGEAASSAWKYIAGAGTAEVKKFKLSNSRCSFQLTVTSDAIGLPGTTAGLTTHDLPVLIDVPTDSGLMTFRSIVELQRAGGRSSRWKR